VKRKALLAFLMAGILLASLVAYLLLAMPAYLHPEYGWGKEGKLKLDLALERTEITINESLNYTVTLTNIGTETVRLYIGYFGAYASIQDENNQTPRYFGPMMAPPLRPDDPMFNSMMKVIEPGHNITERGSFANHTAGGGQHDLRPGKTYHVIAGYSCTEDRPYPALPHWLGELRSEAKYFTIKG